MPDEKILGPAGEGDPIAARCLLGWYVQGGCGSENVLTNAVTNFTLVSATSELEDFLGIEKRCKCAMDEENRADTETMQQSLTMLESGAHQINLPWKKPPAELLNNYEYAAKRLVKLEKQFRNKPHQWEVYCKQNDDQLKRGVARSVPQVELGKLMWFLPHFGVLKDSRTTPVRVVYDSKA
jgi:hypothetical protein